MIAITLLLMIKPYLMMVTIFMITSLLEKKIMQKLIISLIVRIG